MVKWEGDLGNTFSEKQWSTTIQYAHHSSACANHKEQYQKLLTRWYYTPLRLAKAYPSSSPHCWRACGSVGSLLHIFWSCPLLRSFWNEVFLLISDIIHRPSPNTPEFALLLVGIESIPRIYRIIVCNILHATRLTIARHWKSVDIPTLGEATNIISRVFLHERTLAWHRGTTPSFQNQWSPWQVRFPPPPWKGTQTLSHSPPIHGSHRRDATRL